MDNELPSSQATTAASASPSPQSIILIGKPGVGKSSIANMLTAGDIHEESNFEVSDNAASVTEGVLAVTGRNRWTAFDTVGLGQMEGNKDKLNPALELIRKVLENGKPGFHHIAYVVKAGRLTTEEHQKLFSLFKATFAGAEDNFVIIVTHCTNEEWTTDNADAIQKVFGNVDVVHCDFPFKKNNERSKDADREERMESLSKLERQLRDLNRRSIVPNMSRPESADENTKSDFEKALKMFFDITKFIFDVVLFVTQIVA
ncbi:hypothetical protein BGX27_009651 [Mortierella sp. AM989]|nr:hypothetical protein BGX27_009651 [Mortierella sp. AM989]